MGLDTLRAEEVKGWKAEEEESRSTEAVEGLRLLVETTLGPQVVVVTRDRAGIEALADVAKIAVDMTGLAEYVKEWYFGEEEK